MMRVPFRAMLLRVAPCPPRQRAACCLPRCATRDDVAAREMPPRITAQLRVALRRRFYRAATKMMFAAPLRTPPSYAMKRCLLLRLPLGAPRRALSRACHGVARLLADVDAIRVAAMRYTRCAMRRRCVRCSRDAMVCWLSIQRARRRRPCAPLRASAMPQRFMRLMPLLVACERCRCRRLPSVADMSCR